MGDRWEIIGGRQQQTPIPHPCLCLSRDPMVTRGGEAKGVCRHEPQLVVSRCSRFLHSTYPISDRQACGHLLWACRCPHSDCRCLPEDLERPLWEIPA